MRETIQTLEPSMIREVANAGLGRDDVLAFWFGESDEVTPEVVRNAAIESLQRGETFYSHNLGLPALREAVAAYTSALHPAVDAGRIAITSGGVSALMLPPHIRPALHRCRLGKRRAVAPVSSRGRSPALR